MMRASSSSSLMSATAEVPAQTTVAQHGDPVGELPDLGHAVRDVDDGGPRGHDGPDPFEERVDGIGTERRGGLVEHEQLGTHGERLDDLEQVLLRERQGLDPVVQVDLQPGLVDQPLRHRVGAAVGEHRGGQRDLQVLQHGHVGQHRGVLVDDRDPERGGELGVQRVDGLSLEDDGPESGCVVPVATFMRVDLPAPFSPRMACTSPGRMCTDTSVSAATPE